MRQKRGVTAAKARRSLNSIGRAFAKDIERVSFGAGTRKYVDVVQNLRSVQNHYLEQLQDRPKCALEMRRRVAENELEQSLLHGCTLSVCRARLKALSLLDFENVERKAHFYLLYAKGALARGHRRISKETVSRIAEELQETLTKRKSPLARQCLTQAEKLLAFIEAGGAAIKRPSASP
jgi:hypothetical protein